MITILKDSQCAIKLLGYEITNSTIKPDQDRLQPLRELSPPKDTKTLQRILGLFAHYSKWIPQFSGKIRALARSSLLLDESAIHTFEQLKLDIENSVLHSIDETRPFVIETDASNYAIGATVN